MEAFCEWSMVWHCLHRSLVAEMVMAQSSPTFSPRSKEPRQLNRFSAKCLAQLLANWQSEVRNWMWRFRKKEKVSSGLGGTSMLILIQLFLQALSSISVWCSQGNMQTKQKPKITSHSGESFTKSIPWKAKLIPWSHDSHDSASLQDHFLARLATVWNEEIGQGLFLYAVAICFATESWTASAKVVNSHLVG